jgi:hypothetical protein
MFEKNLDFSGGRFTFCRGDAGWHDIAFEFNGILSPGLEFAIEDSGGELQAVGESARHRERLVFEERADHSLVVSRFITNLTAEALPFESVSDGLLDNAGRIAIDNMHEYTLRYMHSSNVRSEQYPNSRPEYPLVRPVPYQPEHFNRGEGNHFPAFVLCDEAFTCLLVEGDLNQTCFERSWKLGLDGEGSKSKLIRTYQGQQRYLLSPGFELEPGAEVEVSRVFYQILENVHPQDAYRDYIRILNEQYEFYGTKSPMRHGAVFCTWNYGTLHNIDDDLIVRRAQALKQRVPECTHFLIDDGYQANRDGRNGPLDCFYPELDCNRERFPNGMKQVADKIRQTGLVPCIWLSPAVYLDSPLAKDHLEWLLRDASGNPALLGKSTFLDLSVPPAREFFLRVLDLLFVEWGYKGVKFDFMTHWFTLEAARFAHGGSGPEWRDFVFGEIRKRIGEDGLFMTCIAMSMGNPFPGLHADCYRCGCDIHDGTWPEQLKACKATLPQILQEGRETLLLNMDSTGFGNVPKNEQRFRLTWIFITQGIIELGGPVESMPDNQIALWRKLLQTVDRGHKVRCLDEDAFTGPDRPKALMVEYPSDSRMRRTGVRGHLALFNWSDEPTVVAVPLRKAGLSTADILTDFWTGQPRKSDGQLLSETLVPHSAALYQIRD